MSNRRLGGPYNQTLSYERYSSLDPQQRYGSSASRQQSTSERHEDTYRRSRDPDGYTYRYGRTGGRSSIYDGDDEESAYTGTGYGGLSIDSSRCNHDVSGRSERSARTERCMEGGSQATVRDYGRHDSRASRAIEETCGLPSRTQSTRRPQDESRHTGAEYGGRYGGGRSGRGERKVSEARSRYLTGAEAHAAYSANAPKVEAWDDGNYIDRYYGEGYGGRDPRRSYEKH